MMVIRIPLGTRSLSPSQVELGLPLVLEKFAFPQVPQFKYESDSPELPRFASPPKSIHGGGLVFTIEGRVWANNPIFLNIPSSVILWLIQELMLVAWIWQGC